MAGLVVAVLAVMAGADTALLWSRIHTIAVRFPATREGTTWVMIGSDSRSALPSGPRLYGTAAQAPGAHADAVIVIHQDHTGTTIFSVPRDILVSPQPGVISRLTLTLQQGPQALVDGLCRSLNIPASHLVIVTMNAFAAAVDALGGVTITNPAPVRDLYSGLQLTKTGPVRLDGIQVLALVRSRFPQTLTSTGWVPAGSAAGNNDRTRWVGAMFDALASKAHRQLTDPITLQSVAWNLTRGLTTDKSTSPLDFLRLDLRGSHLVDLPVTSLGANGIGATADQGTYSALAAAGYTQTCQPPSV